MSKSVPIVLTLGIACAIASGCGGSTPTVPQAVQSTLRRAANCDDLLGALKADALQKMNESIDRNIAALRRWDDSGFNGVGFGETANAGAAAPAAKDSSSSGSASSYSTTNNQVKGVDEADFVKNDGKYIYLLHGQNFQVIQAWPADQMTQMSSLVIEGYPREMFVDSGRAAIYSAVDPTPIFKAAGLPDRNVYADYGDYYGVMGFGGGGIAAGGAPARDVAACAPGGGCAPWWYGGGITKVTVVSLDDLKNPKVLAEDYFEGQYLSSRRIGTRVRGVLNGGSHGPAIEYWPNDYYTSHAIIPNWRPSRGDLIGAYEDLRSKNTKTINASKIADWLPYVFTKSNGNITAQLERCEDYYVPSQGSTSWGLTQISDVDLASPSTQPNVLSVVGQTDTIYSSTDHMVLAQRGWFPMSWYWNYDVPPDGVTLDYTHLHSFNLNADPRLPLYEGSGTIRGFLNDQFSLDEQNGILRVTATESRTKRVTNFSWHGGYVSSVQMDWHNHLVTLKPNGTNQLVQQGEVPEMAPGERIYSTRFAGNRGYVVTFRQVDPLFVIDLTDASHPSILGSITIPGFSSYMHPLDENHLLTIGQDVVNHTSSLMLEIFDVTNPASPILAQKYAYDTGPWGYSEAQYDHKAFNYFPDKQMLAFPFYAYNQTKAQSTAELFKIDIQNGIQKLGSVDHTQFVGTNYSGWCGSWFTPSVRRTVFMDNILYSISYGGIIATDTTTMTNVTALPFAAPKVAGYPQCG